MARIFLSNLGCKLNQAELEAYARRFECDGHSVVDTLTNADVHVVNSCTVTHVAARDSRKLARRGSRQDGDTPIRTVLTGCYATEQPKQAAGLDGVAMVVDNQDKDDLVDRVYARFPDLAPAASALTSEAVPVSFVPLAFGNTRAAIKVEDGCNMTCSFCIIPSTRGRQRSRSIADVVGELKTLVACGAQEVVVTGVQISSYRDGERRLVHLVEALLEQTEIPRLRLTSIAPWQFDRRLLDLWPSERLCRHFHLSLQSGCSETLKRMRRPYRASQYRDLLAELRERVPGVAITTDVIVGFPGETEAEFEVSCQFVEEARFARTHVFPYSERPGTRSAELRDSVSPQEKKRRVHALRTIAERATADFERAQVGEQLEVLWERKTPGAATADSSLEVVGTSDNYARVVGCGAESFTVGQRSKVVPTGMVNGRLVVARTAERSTAHPSLPVI